MPLVIPFCLHISDNRSASEIIVDVRNKPDGSSAQLCARDTMWCIGCAEPHSRVYTCIKYPKGRYVRIREGYTNEKWQLELCEVYITEGEIFCFLSSVCLCFLTMLLTKQCEFEYF